MNEPHYLAPQPGFQSSFIASPAEVVIGGGSAGCGKTFALLYIPMVLYPRVPNVSATIFRREYKQIETAGGIWKKSVEVYNGLPEPIRPLAKWGNFEHIWNNGSTLQFNHLSDARTTHFAFQGAELAFIGFDELTHFTKDQFMYMLSRNRSTAVRVPFIRATTNPQGEGWVKDMISWYLYPPDYPDEALADYPREDRAGKIRYFTVFEDSFVWADTKQEVIDQLPATLQKEYTHEMIKSFSFIPGKLSDNQILEQSNPQYRASLMALSFNDQMQLLHGRWRTEDNDEMQLFQHAPIQDAFTNSFIQPTGKRYITCDVAFEGRDRLVIVVWDGWVVIQMEVIQKSDGADVLARVQNLCNAFSVPYRNVAFDASGLGGYLRGFLKTAVPFYGGGSAITADKSERYKNLRTQCYYLLSKRFEDCEIYLKQVPEQYRKEIADELKATKRKKTSTDSQKEIVPKEVIKIKIGRSPDFADTLSMRCIFDLIQQPKERRSTAL